MSGGACPRCGAAHSAGQRYCLDCGLPLTSRQTFVSRRRRIGSPDGWVWRVLFLLLLGTVGALAAVVFARGGKTETVVATRVRLAHVVRQPAQTTPLTPTPTLPVATAPPVAAPPTGTPRRSALTPWPEADGYTVVLESVPAADGATARRAARHALAKGLQQVGIIDSKEFASLAPGYLVVFTGVFDSAASAADHIDDARNAGFQSAYERQIAR